MKYALIGLIISVLAVGTFFAQTRQEVRRVPVVFHAPNLDGRESEVLMLDSVSYVPAVEILHYVGIQAIVEEGGSKINGFYRDPERKYVIDIGNRSASFAGKDMTLAESDRIIDRNVIYVTLHFLNELFGLDLSYNARRLWIESQMKNLPSSEFQALHRRFLQSQIQASKLLPEPDFFVERDYAATGAGRFSWNIDSRFAGSHYSGSQYTLRLGSKVVGGDLTLNLRGYSTSHSWSDPTLRGQYRIPFPDNSALRQIILGNLVVPGIFFVDALGAEVTNRPLHTRTIYSREVFRGQFGPSSDIEIRAGLENAEFASSDQSGNYQFDVPIFYGLGELQVKAFNEFGQTQTLRYFLNVPQQVLPPGEIEYSVAAGRTTADPKRFVSLNSFGWGVSDKLTVGMKLDYYDFVASTRKVHPALTASSRITESIVLDGLVAPSALTKFSVSWLPSTISDITLTTLWYDQNSPFNFGNIRRQSEARANIPLYTNRNQVRLNLLGRQTDYRNSRQFDLEVALSASLDNVFPRISTQVVWTKPGAIDTVFIARHLTNISIAARMSLNIIVRGSITYDHFADEIQIIELGASKSITNRLNASIRYDRIPSAQNYNISLQVRYILPFMQTTSSITKNADSYTYGFSTSGVADFDFMHNVYHAYPHSPALSYGGFILNPFVDANGDGIQQRGEESVQQGKIYYRNNTIRGSAVLLPKNTFLTSRLLPYEDYTIYLDPQSLDNPLLVPKYRSVRMFSELNYMKTVDMPLVFSGTIRGSVHSAIGNAQVAHEGIKVLLRSLSAAVGQPSTVISVSTFSTGEFEFNLIRPGRYKVELDGDQLSSLGVSADPPSHEVTITSKPEGDSIQGIDFTLKAR